MATTYVDYTATASQTDFAFNFDYLEDEHVIVEINGSATTEFTIVTSPAKKVVLNTGATAGAVVRVRRKSQPDTNLVDFVNGSVLTESELDRAYLHNRYLNEEIAELNDASLQIEAGGTDWDARTKKIKNLADPTLTTDATTKDYVDGKFNQAASGASNPPLKWVFTGTAGADTTYTVTGAEINGDTAYDVSIDGSVLEPTTDYTVDPNTDTLTIKTTLTGGEDIVIIQRGFGIPISTGEIGSAQISADSITTAKIADSAVTTPKIADAAVTTAKLSSNSVTASKISNGSIDTDKIADTAVTTAKIADNAVTTDKLADNIGFVPTGTVSAFAGSTAPTGYLLCDGSTVSRTTYTNLAAVLENPSSPGNYLYGNGDGSTTFNLPDLRGRVIAGQDDMGGSSANRLTGQTGGVNGDTLGGEGGSETHTLTEADTPSHTHYAVKKNTTSLDDFILAGDEVLAASGPASNINERYALTETTEGDPDTAITSSTGGDQAHNNVQPTIILNYIIKA